MNVKRVKEGLSLVIFLVFTVWGFIYLWALLGG